MLLVRLAKVEQVPRFNSAGGVYMPCTGQIFFFSLHSIWMSHKNYKLEKHTPSQKGIKEKGNTLFQSKKMR